MQRENMFNMSTSKISTVTLKKKVYFHPWITNSITNDNDDIKAATPLPALLHLILLLGYLYHTLKHCQGVSPCVWLLKS